MEYISLSLKVSNIVAPPVRTLVAYDRSRNISTNRLGMACSFLPSIAMKERTRLVSISVLMGFDGTVVEALDVNMVIIAHKSSLDRIQVVETDSNVLL